MRALKCVICSIESQTMDTVKDADYVVNGQSVCHDHVESVQGTPGATSVLISKKVGE